MTSQPKTLKSYHVAGRTIRGYEEGGELWFIGRDIASAIGTNPSNQQWDLEDYERGVAIVETKGGPQAMKTVSASGLISLIFRSKRPEALEFRQWAYSLVVPYLRLRIAETRGVNSQEEREARREALRRL
jgi:prophage antirepressor-like protein